MIEIGASRTRGFCLNFARRCNKKNSSDRKVSESTLQGIGKMPLGDLRLQDRRHRDDRDGRYRDDRERDGKAG